MFLFLRSLLIITFIFPHTHFAYANTCQSYFEDTLPAYIKDSQVEKEWALQKNVFSDSLPSTIVSGFTWLTLVQVIRHSLSENRTQPIFTESFWVTLPTDIMLTLISHALSLKEIPALQKFLDGKFLGNRFEYFSRTLANTLVNSSVIVATWAAFGIDINKGTIGAALALCAAVYSVLQITKPFLFKTVPQNIGKSQFQDFQNLFPTASEAWTQVAKESLPLEGPSLEMHFVYALENIVLNIPIEGRLKPQLIDSTLYQKISSQKEKFLNDPSKKNYEGLRKLRLDVIKSLLTSLEKKETSLRVQEDIAQVLKLDSELTPEDSIHIHRYLIKTRNKRQAWLYTASFIDQAISVGIAGGIFLYSTTHWALTGTWPL